MEGNPRNNGMFLGLHTNDIGCLFYPYQSSLRESADMWGFVVQSLGLVWKDLLTPAPASFKQ